MALCIEDHCFRILENQARLFDFLGEHDWGLDMDRETLQFTRRGRKVAECAVQILGSKAIEDNTWLWSWANEESHLPQKLIAGSERLRAEGIKLSDRRFAEPMLPLDEKEDVELAIIGAGELGLFTYYACGYDGGVLFTGIERTPVGLDGPRTVLETLRTLRTGISVMSFMHRPAVYSYLGEPKGSTEDLKTTWLVSDGAVTVAFDEKDRIAEMTTVLTRSNSAPNERRPWWRFGA